LRCQSIKDQKYILYKNILFIFDFNNSSGYNLKGKKPPSYFTSPLSLAREGHLISAKI